MTQVSEITEQKNTSQEVPEQSGLLLTLAKIIIKNPSVITKLRVMGPDEERYVRPQRQYEIPPFRDDMRYSTSNEQYLRPTRWCNSSEPTVVAMANELGAYELPHVEFAEAAYWFIKTKMAFEICPFDSAGATLRRGTGSCFHLINVFVALCRAAGIKARYKNYKMRVRGIEQDVLAADQTMQELFNAMGGVIAEGEGEVCVNGKWTVAYVAQNAAASAAPGWPITKFGEDSIGLYFDALPGTVQRFESLPLRLGLSTKIMKWLVPATMERANVTVHKALAIGWEEIEAAGGIEAYDQKARRKRELFSPEDLLSAQALKHSDKIKIKRK
jgi:hypothetical protein